LIFTKKDVLIHNNSNISVKDFDVIQINGGVLYAVNPHSMIRTLVDHFPSFIDRLTDSDPQYDELRARFERFFDEFYTG
jgi:hypothetical protein